MDWGLKNRLSRIIKPETGRTVMLAIDHGYFLGPTSGLEEPKEIKPQFILNGIMYLNDGPQAIINNSTVSEGEMTGGAKVMRINKNNVVLNFNDLEITLSLKK